MFIKNYDASDISYYLAEINKLLKDENSEKITLDEASVDPEAIDPIVENLQKIYFELRRKEDEKFEDKMRQQRYERGYSDRDVWNINTWFISTLKPMLIQLRKDHAGSPAFLGKNYQNENGIWVNDTCHEEWDKILDRMIFLLGEMDEETCTKTNPYDEEMDKARNEFHEKYGFFGEGLKSEEEKAAEEKSGLKRMYFPSDEPGREDVNELTDKWLAENQAIDKYRDDCKNEFFELFSKYFWNLWD